MKPCHPVDIAIQWADMQQVHFYYLFMYLFILHQIHVYVSCKLLFFISCLYLVNCSVNILKKKETEKGWGEPFIYCLQAHLLLQIYTSCCCQQRHQCDANLVTVTSCLVQLTLWTISDCSECCVLPPSIMHCLDLGTIIFFCVKYH